MVTRPPLASRLSASIVPVCSMIPVNILQVSFDGEVRAELLHILILKRWKKQLWRDGKGDTIVARDLWRVEQEKFVDDASGKNGTIERRAGFQQDAEDFAAAQFRED